MNKTLLNRLAIGSSFILLFALLACNSKNSEVAMPSQPEGKGSVAEGEIVIKRYEKALFALDKNNLRQGMASLSKDYSFFLGNEWQDTMNILRIYNFLNDPNIKELYILSMNKYPDVSFLANDLNNAFDRYLQAYPGKTFPVVYTYVSGLDIENPVYFMDTAMAIGLDIFLGADVDAYLKAGLPKYKINRFTKDHILPRCMLAVSDNIIRVDESRNSLLDQMVLAGKALYFLDVTLPDVKDEFKIGYTTDQLAWSHSHEREIWAFIIGQQLLFSSNPQGVSKLMTDAPFSAGFAAESPGRLGEYIGWQIVRAYMQKADNVTLKQLMENTDAQEILKVSGFKPGKG